jgi:hypothetical protein
VDGALHGIWRGFWVGQEVIKARVKVGRALNGIWMGFWVGQEVI